MINPLTSNLYNAPHYQSATEVGSYDMSPMPISNAAHSRSAIDAQSQCRLFAGKTHITSLRDKQLATLELAFSKLNFGKNVTIWKSENTSDKLRETADLINRKLTSDCPTSVQIDFFRLCSSDCNKTIYQSDTKSVKGTISFPVRPESLSYVDSGDVSCLLIDVKTADGTLARVDITKVSQALETEYLDRVRTKLLTSWAAPSFQ